MGDCRRANAMIGAVMNVTFATSSSKASSSLSGDRSSLARLADGMESSSAMETLALGTRLGTPPTALGRVAGGAAQVVAKAVARVGDGAVAVVPRARGMESAATAIQARLGRREGAVAQQLLLSVLVLVVVWMVEVVRLEV